MLNILFPRACNGCGNTLLTKEDIICAKCRHNLPLACHHRTDNLTMKNIFYGRFPIENATALIRFQKKGITQQILHNLKYKNTPKISNLFGKWLGEELKEHPRYSDIDLIIPVPLHKNKLKKRGYNQVSGFGYEISEALKKPFREDLLVKISKTNSQVFKKRGSRFIKEEIFAIQKTEAIENKHILLVDDIVTTGATLENCSAQLLKCKGVRISIATIAIV